MGCGPRNNPIKSVLNSSLPEIASSFKYCRKLELEIERKNTPTKGTGTDR